MIRILYERDREAELSGSREDLNHLGGEISRLSSEGHSRFELPAATDGDPGRGLPPPHHFPCRLRVGESRALNSDQVRTWLADVLEEAADAHEAGNYPSVARHFASVDVPATRGEGPDFVKIGVALNFFDSWVDASNHEWQYYDGFEREDWPRLARIIAASLRTNTEIPSALVNARFGLEASVRDPSIIARIKRWLEREAEN